MTINIGWPQLIWICLMVAAIIQAAIFHGEKKSDEHNVWATSIAAIVLFFILKWGGFFG